MVGRGRFARGYRTAVGAVVALTVVCSMAGAASGSTKSQIASAKRRLVSLEHEITAGRARVDAMQGQLRALAIKVQAGRARYDAIHAELVATRNALAREHALYHSIRHRLDRRARDAYMQGPGSDLELLLSATSFSNFTDRIEFVNAVAQSDVDLANRAQQLAAALHFQAMREQVVLRQQAAVVRTLSAEEASLAQSFAQEQSQLASLARARVDAASLVRRLHKRLRAEQLAAARSALSGGTPLTFGGWASAFLSAAGYPVSRNNMVVMVAWQTAEYTDARWNPLATTYSMPGSSSFNSVGVQNYGSLAEGIQATIATLRASGYGYEAILSDLASSVDPYTTAGAINASSWCRGCAGGTYVVGLISAVESYYSHYAGA
jgi:peptidoglycan hydrolase CwlO-like protein